MHQLPLQAGPLPQVPLVVVQCVVQVGHRAVCTAVEHTHGGEEDNVTPLVLRLRGKTVENHILLLLHAEGSPTHTGGNAESLSLSLSLSQR